MFPPRRWVNPLNIYLFSETHTTRSARAKQRVLIMPAKTYSLSEHLPLNKTVLCFFPQQDGLDCTHVGQVTVETRTKYVASNSMLGPHDDTDPKFEETLLYPS